MYKILRVNGKENCIIKGDNELCIPFEPGLKQYQDYLEWVAEGNTPEYIDITEE